MRKLSLAWFLILHAATASWPENQGLRPQTISAVNFNERSLPAGLEVENGLREALDATMLRPSFLTEFLRAPRFEVVKRILSGETLTQKEMLNALPSHYVTDWNKLRRWHLPRAVLLPGTMVANHVPGPWEHYKWHILGGTLLIALESLLILNLVLEVRKRKQSELGLKDLSRRLINAQEEERRRIARELHDDLNQRMALLAGHLEDLAKTSGESPTMPNGAILRLSQETTDISGTISSLSHRLHSSTLDILGLAAALRGLCRELSQTHHLEIDFICDDDVNTLSPENALCLFRLAQESLTNVVKHSGARTAHVSLGCRGAEMVELAVEDDGRGFEVARLQKDGLGFLSMRERLRLVGGELSIKSELTRGTRCCFRVPHRSTATESTPSAA